MDSKHRSLVGTGRRCSTGKRCQCEVAHTSPPAGTITFDHPGLSSGVLNGGTTMLGGDLCKRSTPQVELDQRARDTRLALERIERLIVRAPDRCLPGSGKTFIDAALAYGAKDRRIAPLGALVAGISIVTINSAIIAAT